jgi:hypothetical protein
VWANEQAYDRDLVKITEESVNLPKAIVEFTEAIAGASHASTRNIAYMNRQRAGAQLRDRQYSKAAEDFISDTQRTRKGLE